MRVDLYEFSDILRHATTIGYSWNQAHEILVKDEVCPMYEITVKDLYMSDFILEDQEILYGFSEDTCKIVTSFFLAENLTDFKLYTG